MKLETQRTGRTLRLVIVEHGTPDIGIPKKRHTGEPGDSFLKQLQPLPAELRGDIAEAGDVAAGTREARDEPGPERIGADRHHNRNRMSLLFGRRNGRISGRHDHVHLEAYQLPREVWKTFGPGFGMAKLKAECLAFDMAKLP